MNLIESSYRVTREQSDILLDADNVTSRRERITGKLPRDLQPDVFECAWQMAIDRHPALRTAFEWKGLREPVQHVNASADCVIDRVEADGDFVRRHDEVWKRRFNPAQAPLMHLSLGRNHEGEWLFAWTSHELILDSRARRIVMKDVAEIYESLIHSRPIRPVTSPSFQPYVERCHQAGQNKAAAYGGVHHEASAKTCKLLIPRPDEQIQGDPWASATVAILAQAEARLRDFAHKIEVPLNVVVQCVWAVLLSKYSSECEVSFGALQTSQLDFPGALEIVGPLASTVVRHLNVHPGRSIVDVAHDLNAQIVDSAVPTGLRSDAHSRPFMPQAERFETMVRVLEADTNGHPRLDDAFWRDQMSQVVTGCGVTLAGSVATALALEIIYDRRRCDSACISGMAGQLSCLLESISQVERVGQLSLNTETDKQHLVLVGDSSGLETGNAECVYEWFEQQARRCSTQVAVVHEGRRVSYFELEKKVDQLAARLRRSGIGPEALVGLYLPRGLNMIVSVLAVLKSGGAYLPLDIDAPVERVRDILLDAKPQCLLVEEEAGAMSSAPCELVHVNAKVNVPADPPVPPQALATGAAYVLYTSGSTGRPKGVVVENRQLLNYVKSIIKQAGLEECRHFAMLQPLTVDSSVTVLYASLCTGGTLHVIGEELAMDPVALSAYFEGEKIDCLKIAPSHLAALHSGVAPSRLVPQRRLIVGGEGSSYSWLTSIALSAPACAIFNHYGPTETTVGVLMHRFDESKSREGGLVPIGQPLANCRAYVLDPYGELVPRGVIGELYIGGDAVARGYINRPSLTALQFLPDPFAPAPGHRMYRTGDLVRCLPGNLLEFCGRADNQIKLRGYRVEPGEITSVLEQHPDVNGAVVMPFRCSSGGQQLAAFVVSHRGKPLEGTLRTLLQSKLPHYMVPNDIIVLDKFPLSRHGKIDIRSLPLPVWVVDAKAQPK
jgi:amino acid adenylation domain-containing protein